MRKIAARFLISIVFLLCVCNPSGAVLRLHFIAVGHGDAVLIEEDGSGVALVDAGKPQAGPVVLDYLAGLGIRKLDHLFVTHNHEDHVGSVPLILDSIEVGIIHHTGMVDDWEAAQAFADYLATGQWLVDVTDAGDIPISRGDLNIEVLSPLKEETEGKTVDPNRYSLVLLVTYGEVKILLPADIDKDREKWLIDRYGPRLDCRAMKASHHASRRGNCKQFLEAVSPEVVVVTVGPNTWGYPSDKTLNRLRQHCPTVLRTDEVGTVILETDGKSLSVSLPESEGQNP